MPTLDDIVASMRSRFTPQQAGQVVADARITAEEWNVLASFVFLRDAAKALTDMPKPDDRAIERLKDEVLLQASDRAGKREKR